jgi:N-sulfoglucosamine sulfohydrolase
MVSTVDIAPTVYDIAGIKSPLRTHGQSLRSRMTGSTRGWRQYLGGEFHMHGGNIFYPRRTVRDGRYQIIHNLLSKSRPPLGIDGDTAHKAVGDSRFANTPARRAFDTYMNPPEYELYDLTSDPVEFVNIAGSSDAKPVLERMKAALMTWRKETGDPFLDQAFLEKFDRDGPPVKQQRR